MTVDSTLEFEKRRNIPVKYDRELYATTVKAVSRIQEIRAKREKAFYRARMAKAAPASLRGDALEVLSGSHLLGKDRHDPIVQKALAAAEIKAIKKRQRKLQGIEQKVQALQDGLEEAGDEESVLANMREADDQDMDEQTEETREKIKIKVPARSKKSSARSALVPAANGASMGMHID